MKRFLTCLIAATLCLIPLAALGEILFNDSFFSNHHLRDKEIVGTQSAAVSQNGVYDLLSNGDVYSWNPATKQYVLYAQVPAIPSIDSEKALSALDDSTKAAIEASVYYLIGTEDGVYGLNPITGAMGPIDANGIQWNPTRLDTTLLKKYDTPWPQGYLGAFMENEQLFVVADLAGLNGAPQTALLAFDLASGSCASTELPNVITLCPYRAGSWLALLDDGSQVLQMAQYDLATQTWTKIPTTIPISVDRQTFLDAWDLHCAVGGLAYDSKQDTVYVAGPENLWSSVAGAPFAKISLSEGWEELNPMGQAWVLADGQFVFQNGSLYITGQ